MSSPMIKARGVAKRYRIGAAETPYKTVRESIMSGITAPFRNLTHLRSLTRFKEQEEANIIWALKDVSFDVNEGEVVGIIGHNGAGKTTLLKIMSRITEPTAGYIEIGGRVSSLLEVGTGFHPELTGRENIFLNGAILGMRKREIEEKFDDIVEFSEVSRYIDTQVKRYSSGMTVRLAFSVAAFLEPEILLVDEVLAVGDVAFQKKSLGKMEDVAHGGRTVFFVSHNMGMINTLCQRCLLIENGHIVMDGDTPEVVSHYLKTVSSPEAAQRAFPEDPQKKMQIRQASVLDSRSRPTSSFDVFDPVTVEIEYEVRENIENTTIALTLHRDGMPLLLTFDADRDEAAARERQRGSYRSRVTLPCPLKAGNYTLELATGFISVGTIDHIKDALAFEVEELSFDPMVKSYARRRTGVTAADLTWETERCG